jgi:membrane protein
MARRRNDKEARFKTRRATLQMKAAGLWDVVSDAVRNFSRNGDDNQAAAIALYTILSVIPLLILTIIAAGSFFSSNPHIQGDILNAVKGFHPYFSETLVAQLGQIEGKSQVLGWIGVLGLVWLSLAIFNAIESALNIIFRSQERRNYFISKLMAFCMIPLGWIIGGLSVFTTYVAALFAASPLRLPGRIEISLTLPAEIVLRYLLPYVMVVVLVTAVYKIIPTAKIRFSVALAGAAVFGLLLEIAKQFFTWYLANYTRYNVIFGSLETIVILVIWVFYVALIFLFCAEIMSSRERRNLLLLERALLKPHVARMKVEERLFEKFGRVYPKDGIIFNEGDTGGEMFYILSGRVCLERVDCSVQKTLAEMGQGQYFGEMAVLIDIRRSATARAMEDSHLAVIDAATFQNLIRESQDVAITMLREFSSRLKHSNATLEEFTSLWTRLMIIIHFLNANRAKIGEHLSFLAAQSGKNPVEIEALIGELASQNILIVDEDAVMDVDREKIWSLFEADALKKCLLESHKKMFAGVIRK